MAITSGFFDSMNDRYYTAEQFGAIFDGVIGDGVFATVANHFLVAPLSGMQIVVKSGKAWFNHTWTVNDADISLTVPAAHSVNPRIDTVVLEVNKSPDTRKNSIFIRPGTPAASPVRPTLEHSTYINQYPLADIRVNANATSIGTANITNRIGTKDCPWVAALMKTIDATALMTEWRGKYTQFEAANQAKFEAWVSSLWTPSSEDEYTEIMEHLAAASSIRTVTLKAGDWSGYQDDFGGYIYHQTVDVAGVTEDYTPTLVKYTRSDFDTGLMTQYNRNFSIIAAGRGVTGNGTITWFCYGDKPTTNITIGLRGI